MCLFWQYVVGTWRPYIQRVGGGTHRYEMNVLCHSIVASFDGATLAEPIIKRYSWLWDEIRSDAFATTVVGCVHNFLSSSRGNCFKPEGISRAHKAEARISQTIAYSQIIG